MALLHEQKAVLVQNHGEWVLITEDKTQDYGKPQSVWEKSYAAMGDLRRNGWKVVGGPVLMGLPGLKDLDGFEPWGYTLRRSVK